MRQIFSGLWALCIVVSVHDAVSGQGTTERPYRATETHINDLVHTRLEVAFDYDRSCLNGKAWISLRPHFYPTDTLSLDAKEMSLSAVKMVKDGKYLPLSYTYDHTVIRIRLDRRYSRQETYTVYVEYTALPEQWKDKAGNTMSLSKGLYFINPQGKDKNKPVEIWTQGEPECTSVWCPTIDRPDQKMTTDISMKVPDRYLSLSNGILAGSHKEPGGFRTDRWKMDLPHSPYLLFLCVGPFVIVKDQYKGKEVSYYVEKEYAQVARRIFGNTPEMIALFSRLTGVDYPWQKYAQVVVRDYTGGAMENTTATVHQEDAQQNARELVDNNRWEGTIAHELFHQWFGDYVTAESWSNLTLNESFASYGVTLWNEYKYGKDQGDEVNYNSLFGYRQSHSEKKALVRYYYDQAEDMFDAVSYNKGGCILNMLRSYVGDSAFFRALHLYLINNRLHAAEVHQLRMAFEEVTGRDLNWFFDQWYFGAGHPKLDITYVYNDTLKQVKVKIRQTQEGDRVYRLPLHIDVYEAGGKTRYAVEVTGREQELVFNYTTRPELVNVDADKATVCEKKDAKSIASFIYQYKYAANYADRREAIEACAGKQDDADARGLLALAMKDPCPGLRFHATALLDLRNPAVRQQMEPSIRELALHEPTSILRARAIRLLGEYKRKEDMSLLEKAVSDSSYSVSGEALAILARGDTAYGIRVARALRSQEIRGRLADVVTGILVDAGYGEDFDLLADRFEKLPMTEYKLRMARSLATFLGKLSDTRKFRRGIDIIVAFRDAIPEPYRAQTVSMINNVILKGIADRKQSQLQASPSVAVEEQIQYINTKIKL